VVTPGRVGHPREFAYKLAALCMLVDWVVACAAIFLGLILREWQRSDAWTAANLPESFYSFLFLWSMAAAAGFAWLLATQRAYEARNMYNISQSLRKVFKAIMYWSLSLWAFVGFFRVTGFTPRLGAIYCMVTLAVSFVMVRVLFFFLLTRPRARRAANARVLVIGWNREAARLRATTGMEVAELGEIIGCVARPDGSFTAEPPADLPVLGHYASLDRIIREHGVNLLVLGDTAFPPDEIQRLTLLCEREMITFRIIVDYFQALKSGLQVQTVSGVPLLGRSELPIDRTLNRFMKRSMDIVGGLLGLSVVAIVMPFFGLLVYLESPGPIIFRQRRTSRSGHAFYIYKIRSMKMHAEKNTGAVWCTSNDARRLRIGAFMRRWNIDELPQFYNVLVGDMSLVGPRPERPELIERFKDEIPSYNVRHEVRTGLTGWAQINGLRGDTDLRKRIDADLYYIENWSIPLDIYCLAATFFKIKNAY